MRSNEISEQPKNVSALRLNQPGQIFETAVPHGEKLNCDAGLGVVAQHNDTIERAAKKPKGRCQANGRGKVPESPLIAGCCGQWDLETYANTTLLNRSSLFVAWELAGETSARSILSRDAF